MKFRSCLAAVLSAVIALPPLPVAAQTSLSATLLPPGKQCFQATAGVNGMVGTLGTLTGGAAYVAGTYGGVALTGGSGSGATANITVAGGAVTAVTVLNPGTQYVIGDVLSAAAASIGGAGAGFSVPVTATSINSSLAGGSVGYYVPSTLTTKQTWQNSTETVLNANPVPLDANGCATVYGFGAYRQVLKDSLGNTVWDVVTASTGSGSATGTPLFGDGAPVGAVMAWSSFTLPSANWAYAQGQTLNRTTYADLFSAVTFQQLNAVCSAGSTTLSGLSDTTQIPINAGIEGACIPPGTSVTAKAAGSVTMSVAATSSTSVTARFFPYGGGDGSTTFNLPDYRGQTLVGRNNMGGVPSFLSQTYYAANPNALGAPGGTQSTALGVANLPAYTPAGTIANGAITNGGITITNGAITSTVTGGTIGATGSSTATSGGGSFLTNGSAIVVTSTQATTTAAQAPTTQAASTFTGTAQGGTATPISNIQPSETVNYIIKIKADLNPGFFFGVSSLGGMQGALLCGTGIVCNAATLTVSNGGVTSVGAMTGDITCGAGITCSGSAISANITGLTVLAPVTAATTTILPNTPAYANGAAGVGATLTAGSNGALSIDGVAVTAGNRVLIKDQASQFQNGIYTVTAAGSGGTAYVLTRVTDFDQAAEMTAGSSVLVIAGTVNANSSYVLSLPVATVGTTAVVFNLFSTGSITVVNNTAGSPFNFQILAATIGALQ